MTYRELFDSLELDELFTRGGAKWGRYTGDVLPMCSAELDFPLAEPVAETIIDLVRSANTGYASDAPALVEAYLGFASRRWAWAPAAESVLVVDQFMPALEEVLRALFTPGSRIAYLAPSYIAVPRVIERAGSVPAAIAVAGDAESGWSWDLDALEDAFAGGVTGLVLVNPHHPHGLVPSREVLEKIAALADTWSVQVVSDEMLAPLAYASFGHPFTPFASLDSDAARRSVSLWSPSKTWNLKSFPVALVSAPDPEVRAAIAPALAAAGGRASFVGIRAATVAYATSDEWLDDLTLYLAENAAHLRARLPEILPGAAAGITQSGFTVWTDLSVLGISDLQNHFIERGRVGFSPGRAFGERGEGFVRINIGTARHVLDEGIDRLASALTTGSRAA